MITMVSTQHSLQLWWFRDIFLTVYFHRLFSFPIRKSGNHLVRHSWGLSFTSHSKLRMRDNGKSRIPYMYIHIFICIFVLTWQVLNGYFILIFMFLFNKCIDKLHRYCRITFNNHLLLGILDFKFFLRVFQVAFRWRIICLAFVCCLISGGVGHDSQSMPVEISPGAR